MKWTSFALFVAGSVCVAALTMRTGTDSCDLTGEWLTTLEFSGRRPVWTMITFLDTRGASDRILQGRWERTAANRFAVEFRLPAEDLEARSDCQYHVTGILTLECARGRLLGPVTVDVRDGSGKVVDSLGGIVKATRHCGPERSRDHTD